MVTFSVTHAPSLEGLTFQVRDRSVAFAGSRHGYVPPPVARQIVHCFHALDFSFLTGCANGIDSCFRQVLSDPCYAPDSLIACASDRRARRSGTPELLAATAVPAGLSPKAALHRRTVWMVRRCSLLVIFPYDPETGRWGGGSSLAFRTAAYNLKPVFVSSLAPPPRSSLYRMFPASLFGIVPGFWTVPHQIYAGGPCDEE